MAIKKAQEIVQKTGDLSVPLPLRNAPTKLMKDLGYGADYRYAHDFEGNFVSHEFLPESISGTSFYSPGDNQREKAIKAHLDGLWQGKY
jgi:putative ATPase